MSIVFYENVVKLVALGFIDIGNFVISKSDDEKKIPLTDPDHVMLFVRKRSDPDAEINELPGTNRSVSQPELGGHPEALCSG
jgi:hypothetical protein